MGLKFGTCDELQFLGRVALLVQFGVAAIPNLSDELCRERRQVLTPTHPSPSLRVVRQSLYSLARCADRHGGGGGEQRKRQEKEGKTKREKKCETEGERDKKRMGERKRRKERKK